MRKRKYRDKELAQPVCTASRWRGTYSNLAILTATVFCLTKILSLNEIGNFSSELFIFLVHVISYHEDQDEQSLNPTPIILSFILQIFIKLYYVHSGIGGSPWRGGEVLPQVVTVTLDKKVYTRKPKHESEGCLVECGRRCRLQTLLSGHRRSSELTQW